MNTPERITIDGTSAPIYHVHCTPSTNDLAANLLTDTATPTPHLTTIIADRQSAGRGRLGRTWIAPEGEAILASTVVSLPTSIPTDQLGWLVYACGLAVRDALARRLEPLDHSVCLKWPNDVLVDGERKICGILAQLAPASSPFTTAIILGYGINVAQRPDNLATEQATSLYAEGDDEAAEATDAVIHAVLADVLSGLEKRVRALIAHGNAHTADSPRKPQAPYRSSAAVLRSRSRRTPAATWHSKEWRCRYRRPVPSSCARMTVTLTTSTPATSWLPEYL